MKKITVYIDESGTFPDPHDKLIVIAAVGTFSVEKIDIMLKKIKKKTAVKKGKIKGAEILVVGAITGWDPGSSGTGGGIGFGTRGFLGGIGVSVKKSTMAMDIRIIDTATSEVLAATRVEGEATDVSLGFLAGGIVGDVGLAGGLGTYAKTPMEKAIRTCLYEAAKYIIDNTPKEYFKH